MLYCNGCKVLRTHADKRYISVIIIIIIFRLQNLRNLSFCYKAIASIDAPFFYLEAQTA